MPIVPFKRINDTATNQELYEVSLEGELLLDYPLLNKGSAFTDDERREFRLVGLLPPHVSTVEDQVARNYENYRKSENDLGRYLFLTALQDRNETLFYRLVEQHIAEMLPIIYTPVVGVASQSYSHIYRRPRGLYISYPHRNEMRTILENAPRRDVRAIVVTDGERILGLGDLGVGGMGIPVGKLSLYTLCAGIHPATTLPVFLDVGTNNPELLSDPLYLGWRHERIRGQEYDDFIDAFIQNIKDVFPDALLQWEDFSRSNARRLLERYRNDLCTFNDDIQGTGAVTLAGLIAAVKVRREKMSQQRFTILGAGSAATGVADMIVASIVRGGISAEEARAGIWMLDIGGLLHSKRSDLESFNAIYAQPFERISEWGYSESDRITLPDVVHRVQSSVLIGLSGQSGAFGESVVREMAAHTDRPVIFPLSNPTALSEGIPSDLTEWTDGRALIATGSPFPPVSFDGQSRHTAQCNNVYIFPGVGLGVIASGARRVSDAMFMAAAEALSDLSPAFTDSGGPLLPEIDRVREVSRRVAIAVGVEAQKEGLAPAMEAEEWEHRVDTVMWQPRYATYRKVKTVG